MSITTEDQTFDEAQVLAALEAVVKGNEGHVDPFSRDIAVACKYVVGGKPACIVGQALFNLHVPLETLMQMDILGNPMFESDPIEFLKGNGIYFTNSAIAVLSSAQYEQDAGKNWGVALAKARQVYVDATS